VATNNRMALLEQLSKYVVEKDKDFLKEALTLLINALMDAECFLQVLFPRFCKLLFAATPQGILRVALH